VYEAGPAETRSQALRRKYGAVDEAKSMYEEFYHVLRTRPLDEIAEILRRLRAGASVQTLLQFCSSSGIWRQARQE